MGYHCSLMANEPSSWTIILPIATGICGYLGGIISEPLKQITTQWLAKKRMKNVVYAELAHNLDSLVLMTLFGEETGDTYKAKVYRDVLDLNISYKNFEFAETQPLIFHALREATNIRNIYSGFHLFLDGAETKQAISAGIETLLTRCNKEIIEGGFRSETAGKIPSFLTLTNIWLN